MTPPKWLRWRTDEELETELRAHLALEIQANLERGLGPDQARLTALRRFGNRTQVKERAREGDPLFGFETFMKDVVYGLRGLRRNPGFTLAATVSLALGIGANTAIFSLIDGVMLRSLPVVNPNGLVILLHHQSSKNNLTNDPQTDVSRAARCSQKASTSRAGEAGIG